MKKLRALLFLVFALLCGPALAQEAAASQRPGDATKAWQINYDRTAKSDGQVRFEVWQTDQDAPQEVVIPVKKGQTETSIAVQSRDIFREALGVQDFETDVKRANVFIRAKHGERRFSLKVAENSVEGLVIDLYGR